MIETQSILLKKPLVIVNPPGRAIGNVQPPFRQRLWHFNRVIILMPRRSREAGDLFNSIGNFCNVAKTLGFV
jgi:hypothetical protein